MGRFISRFEDQWCKEVEAQCPCNEKRTIRHRASALGRGRIVEGHHGRLVLGRHHDVGDARHGLEARLYRAGAGGPLETEILALRYQLTVLRRKAPKSLAFGTSRYCAGPETACRMTRAI
jgi:hypothetical protein